TMVKHYPRLGGIVQFYVVTDDYKQLGWKIKDLDLLLRFTVIFIDTESPFFHTKKYEDRKSKALNQLNINEDSLVGKEILSSGSLYREFIYQFFKFIHNAYYEQWFTLNMQIHNFNHYLRAPITIDIESKDVNARRALAKEIPALTKQMMKLEASIFNDKRVLKQINEHITQNSIGSYPEKYAKNPPWQEKLKD
nr:hypothetical protein [Bacteroidota bacterium]